jgi:hypothetical protein
VYLPSSYDGSKQFPLWVHLHGVFWQTMGNIRQQVRCSSGWLAGWLAGLIWCVHSCHNSALVCAD